MSVADMPCDATGRADVSFADRKAAGANWKGTAQGLVFTTKNGTPIEPRNLNRSFEALCVRAGVRRVRFHDLRHTCASLLHEQGADARMVMEVLGHSSSA
jgi:integrase